MYATRLNRTSFLLSRKTLPLFPRFVFQTCFRFTDIRCTRTTRSVLIFENLPSYSNHPVKIGIYKCELAKVGTLMRKVVRFKIGKSLSYPEQQNKRGTQITPTIHFHIIPPFYHSRENSGFPLRPFAPTRYPSVYDDCGRGRRRVLYTNAHDLPTRNAGVSGRGMTGFWLLRYPCFIFLSDNNNNNIRCGHAKRLGRVFRTFVFTHCRIVPGKMPEKRD